MAAIYFVFLLSAVTLTLAVPQGYFDSFGAGSYGGHSGYFHSAPTYGGYGHSSGYDAQPAKTEIRPPTSKVTREQKDGEDTTERQLQRQIIHRQRQQNTRSEQTHRHDHHVEKLHKQIRHEVFNPHTITTVNRNHHHHDRNEFVTHLQDINQPIIHKFVRPSQEVRRGASTQTKSVERVEEMKVLTPITRPVQVIRHAPQYAQPMGYGDPRYRR